jgi:hypothetical protein
MTRILRLLTVLCCVISFVGCSSMEVMRSPSPQTVRDSVKVGDEVEILTRTGSQLAMRVTAIDSRTVSGALADGSTKQIPLAEIQELKASKLSGAKTAGMGTLVIAGLVVIGLALVALGGKAIADGLDGE